MQHILFDVDGILINSMPIWENSANLYLKEKFEIDAPKEVDQRCETLSLMEAGSYIKSCYPQIKISPKEIADGVASFIRERYLEAEEMPGMKKTIQALYEKGYHLYLATASEEKNVEGVLKNLGVYSYFHALFTCTELGYSKSQIEFFQEIAKRLGVACEELWIVEDSLHSIKTAKLAGFNTIGIYEEYSKAQQAEIIEVSDYYFKNLGGLFHFIIRQNHVL